jgi:hypothetical protein
VNVLYRGSFNATGAPTADDTATVAWLEGLGHTVTTINASTPPGFTGIDFGVIGGQNGSGMDVSDRQGWVEAPVPVIWMDLTNLYNSGGMSGAPDSGTTDLYMRVVSGQEDHPVLVAAGLTELATNYAMYSGSDSSNRIEWPTDGTVLCRRGSAATDLDVALALYEAGAGWTWTTASRAAAFSFWSASSWTALAQTVLESVLDNWFFPSTGSPGDQTRGRGYGKGRGGAATGGSKGKGPGGKGKVSVTQSGFILPDSGV